MARGAEPLSRTLRKVQLAELLGYHINRIDQLHKMGTAPPRETDGTYQLSKIGEWMRSQYGKGADKSRLAKAHADKAELDLAERRGEVLSKDEVLGNISNGVSKMVKRLQGIPVAVATRIAPADQVDKVKQILTDIIQEALTELYAEAEKYSDEA